MLFLRKAGLFFYGLAIIVYGLQQLVIQDFRPQIVPLFPAWVHTYTVFPLVTGMLMLLAGGIVTGLFPVSRQLRQQTAFYLGCYFAALLLVSHLPYLLFVYPHKLSHLGSWGDFLKCLTFSGSSFVMAASLANGAAAREAPTYVDRKAREVMTLGRIFFCIMIILFGCNHFVYDISGMVPRWLGPQAFWSYFGGAALIAAGTAILLNSYLPRVALLLALMLFLWFILVHAPNAIAYPYAGRGNPIVSAFDALLFCGTALVLSQSNSIPKLEATESRLSSHAWESQRFRL